MTMDIGWYAILLSNFFSQINLAIKKNNTPNNRGSTGRDNESPNNPSRFIDKGVKKAIKKRTLSQENTYNISTPNKTGNANIK